MATKVPAEGIETYMAQQVSQLAPANTIWRIKWWISAGPGVWLVIAPIVIGFTGPMFSSTMKSFVDVAVAVAALPATVVVFVLIIGARDPGYWRRYSISQLNARYPELYKEISWAPLALRLHGYNSEGPDTEAEFEAAVLEWRGKTHGLVLFKVFGHTGPCEEVVQVYSPGNEPVSFGEAYASPAR